MILVVLLLLAKTEMIFHRNESNLLLKTKIEMKINYETKRKLKRNRYKIEMVTKTM